MYAVIQTIIMLRKGIADAMGSARGEHPLPIINIGKGGDGSSNVSSMTS